MLSRIITLTGLVPVFLLAALATLTALAAGHPWPAQDDASLKRHGSADGAFSLALPAAWKARPGNDGNAVLDIQVTATGDGVSPYGRITVFWLKSLQIPEAQPFFDRPVQTGQYGSEKAETGTDPLPHLQLRYDQQGAARVALFIYRVIKGRGLSLAANFPDAGFDAVRPCLFEAAASLSTTLEPWPTDPEGYVEKKRGHYRYLKHGEFNGSEGAYHTLILGEEKGFTKAHGPLVIDPEWLPALLLHPEGHDFSELLPDYAPRDPSVWCDHEKKRLLCHSLPPKKTLERALFIRELSKLFYTLRYGKLQPSWLCIAEGEFAYEQALTGKKLPQISRERHAALPRSPMRFDEVITTLEKENFISFTQHCYLYAALFQIGDRIYQNAYKAFLKHYGETGDYEAATERHLLSLDQDRMASAAVELLEKRLKAPKRQ